MEICSNNSLLSFSPVLPSPAPSPHTNPSRTANPLSRASAFVAAAVLMKDREDILFPVSSDPSKSSFSWYLKSSCAAAAHPRDSVLGHSPHLLKHPVLEDRYQWPAACPTSCTLLLLCWVSRITPLNVNLVSLALPLVSATLPWLWPHQLVSPHKVPRLSMGSLPGGALLRSLQPASHEPASPGLGDHAEVTVHSWCSAQALTTWTAWGSMGAQVHSKTG